MSEPAAAPATSAGAPQLAVGDVLWAPSAEQLQSSQLTAFAREAAARYPELDACVAESYDYAALWRWSIERPEHFWALVWDFCDVAPDTSYSTVLASRAMPGARWFPGATLNYTERLLRDAAELADQPALVSVGEDGTTYEISWRELADQAGSVAAALRDVGVGQGDRVVGYLPNVPQAIIAFLATASIGAIWSVCGPEIGAGSVVDRFAQLEPVVLFAIDSYRFGGRVHDRSGVVTQLLEALPTVREVVVVPLLDTPTPGYATRTWDELVSRPQPISPVRVPFDHPLWVVYSSGTTGLPKGLVHGHGGILVTALGQQRLQSDVRPGRRSLSYTSTSWIMWNGTVSGLLSGGISVLYDGNPMFPSVDRLWQLAAQHRLSGLSVSPGYLLACEKAGIHPARDYDLSGLIGVGSTGSPLPARSYRWVHDELGPHVVLQAFSGGTDFAATLVGGAPWLPVRVGEMSGRALGCHVESWDADGRPVYDEVGELVLPGPMPSMPLRIWGDDDGSRYLEAYFSVYPNVWRHGDWLTITRRGSCIIHGRSDSTLNRNGVRMGSADIYQAVEALPEIGEALVLGVEQPDGGYWLPLFIRLEGDHTLDEALAGRIRAAIRHEASPRHVPDEIVVVPAIPHTGTGKKLEIPLKRIMQGAEVDRVCNTAAVDDPAAVDWFARFARGRRR